MTQWAGIHFGHGKGCDGISREGQLALTDCDLAAEAAQVERSGAGVGVAGEGLTRRDRHRWMGVGLKLETVLDAAVDGAGGHVHGGSGGKSNVDVAGMRGEVV